MGSLRKFFKDDEGVTSLEYGLIASVTCVAIIAALLLIGPQLSTTWDTIRSALVAG